VIRLFNVHFPSRTVLLAGGEALVLVLSFLLGIVFCLGTDSFHLLSQRQGLYKLVGVVAAMQFSIYCFDLYDRQRVSSRGEIHFRLVVIVGILSLLLAGVGFAFPGFLPDRGVFVAGLVIAPISLTSWRAGYTWLLHRHPSRQRVYVLGDGEGSRRLVEAIRTQDELGMELVGWTRELESHVNPGTVGEKLGALAQSGAVDPLAVALLVEATETREDSAKELVAWTRELESYVNRDTVGERLLALARRGAVDQVVVALQDTRMPVRALLELRLRGIRVEDCTSVLEKISGKIEVEELHPSWLVFSKGFRLNSAAVLFGRAVSLLTSLVLLLLLLPLVPLVVLAVMLSSRGPVFFRQTRVGRDGTTFSCYKFRTMCADAESHTGPTWTSDKDERITPLGRWLRGCHLDEIPQLWNVLRGDMNLCGPRPERPEFVEWLGREIPYYDLRHAVRPGITGWAQVNYPYGNTVEDAKEKLSYELFYIKNLSVGLDIVILLRTIKTVLLRRGAK